MNEPDKQGKPLAGQTILVTRARAGSEIYGQKLKALGASVLDFPVLELCEPEDWQSFDKHFSDQAHFDWFVFASANAVDATVDRLKQIGRFEILEKSRIAAIGAATAAKLAEHGLSTCFQPSSFVAESLVTELPAAFPLADKTVFWPRTDIGREVIVDGLAAQGARVYHAVVYKTVVPREAKEKALVIASRLQAGEVQFLTMASAQSVRNFAQIMKDHNLPELLARTQIAVIGPITAREAERQFGRVDIEARVHSLDGLTEAILTALKFPNHKN